ncbi:ABC transporter permease [Sporobacter termitidis]|uniref:ABC transporter permease n=1 Tax=Sporobacter termitidis TaxID=44749 RepID=UPI001FA89EC3|nr:ABC transporter permease subunit [Sporobacter termitidis]
MSYFLVLFPLLILFVWSFTGRWSWPHLLPETFSARALGELFGGYSGAVQVLLSSILLSTAVALIAIAVSVPAARAIVLTAFWGKDFLKFIVLLPVIVPATAFAMGVHMLFIRVGLSDTVVGVILIHIILCLPYTVRIMSEVTAATGDRLEAQARVLGASPKKTLISITFPLAMPGIISAFCMAFIVSFSQYFVTLLIGGGTVTTYAMFMFPYIQSGDRTIAAAYSLLFVLSTLLVFIVLERRIKKYYNIEDVFFFS